MNFNLHKYIRNKFKVKKFTGSSRVDRKQSPKYRRVGTDFEVYKNRRGRSWMIAIKQNNAYEGIIQINLYKHT